MPLGADLSIAALNRANGRLAILHDDGDFAAFERILAEAVTRFDMRLLAYCLMPNHFHLLIWPAAMGTCPNSCNG